MGGVCVATITKTEAMIGRWLREVRSLERDEKTTELLNVAL